MNKFRHIALGLTLISLLGAWLILHANAQPKPDVVSPNSAEEQQYQRMLDEQADRFKRAETILKEQEAQHKRVEGALTKQEDFLERQLKAFKRFETILDTWENQQKQYQKYLDTLPKK